MPRSKKVLRFKKAGPAPEIVLQTPQKCAYKSHHLVPCLSPTSQRFCKSLMNFAIVQGSPWAIICVRHRLFKKGKEHVVHLIAFLPAMVKIKTYRCSEEYALHLKTCLPRIASSPGLQMHGFSLELALGFWCLLLTQICGVLWHMPAL